MNIELENYLTQATAHIFDQTEAKMVKQELEDHILTKIEIMRLGGTSEKEALQQAIQEMGNPITLATNLGFVHNRKYPIRCHIVYYAPEHASAFNPTYACKQLAQRLAGKLDCPSHNCLDNPEIHNLDILIIVGLHRHKKTIAHLHKFARQLTKAKTQKAILITLPLKSPVAHDILYAKRLNTRSLGNNTYFNNTISQVFLKKELQAKDIDVIDEFFCLRHFYLPGLVFAGESERALKSLKHIFKNCT